MSQFVGGSDLDQAVVFGDNSSQTLLSYKEWQYCGTNLMAGNDWVHPLCPPGAKRLLVIIPSLFSLCHTYTRAALIEIFLLTDTPLSGISMDWRLQLSEMIILFTTLEFSKRV